MNKSAIINENIKPALLSLNAQNPFALFDMNISRDEKKILNNFNIGFTKAYNNFGKLNLLTQEVNYFLTTVGTNDDNTCEFIADFIKKLVLNILNTLEKETAWVTIRTSTATNLWDLPRWHSDGYYYSPYTGEQHKLAITLKGASTLFYFLPTAMREKFNSLQSDPDNRETIAKMIDSNKVTSIGSEQGAIFIVGTNYAAIHSEPPIHEERLFISIVPGSNNEIQELYNNWHP